jgi:hypothetical protein
MRAKRIEGVYDGKDEKTWEALKDGKVKRAWVPVPDVKLDPLETIIRPDDGGE